LIKKEINKFQPLQKKQATLESWKHIMITC